MMAGSSFDSPPHLLRAFAATIAAASLLLLASCGGDDPLDGGGGGGGTDTSAILVRGTVLDDDGVEVFGTTISIEVYEWFAEDETCGEEPVAERFETSVNEGGSFTLYMTFDRDEFDACLDILVTPPADRSLQPVQRVLLDQNVNEIGRDPIEQVTVDFLLEP